MMQDSLLQVDLLTDGAKTTTVIVDVQVGDKWYVQGASAVRDHHDEYNPEVGERIALGRALRDIGRQLIRDGYKEVER